MSRDGAHYIRHADETEWVARYERVRRRGTVTSTAAASRAASSVAPGQPTTDALSPWSDCCWANRWRPASKTRTKSAFGWECPRLGLDGLSSAAYGPEAALAVLIPAGAAGLWYIQPISLAVLALLAMLFASYRQTIEAYPGGGGAYTVASENLGRRMGLLAAAALMIDYILNVAVGISAGIAALVSAAPALQPWMLPLCLAVLAAITVANLRGTKEAGRAFALPTYLFIGCLSLVLVWGLLKSLAAGGHPEPAAAPPPVPAATLAIGWWLLLRSFASGCTAMTGVEAVSNGVSIFKPPAVPHARSGR